MIKSYSIQLLKRFLKINFATCRPLYSYKMNHFSEKLNIKQKIELVDIDMINEEKEDWGELLSLSLVKENYMKFQEQLNCIIKQGVTLELSDLNKIISLVYTKNVKTVDLIRNYIYDKSIPIDSITYYYFISSYLQFKNFKLAFEIFFEAYKLNVPQNISVIISLNKEINLIENEEEKIKFQAIVDEHVKKFYPDDVIELLESLNFEKYEEVESDSKKSKKNKKNKNEKIDKTDKLSTFFNNSVKSSGLDSNLKKDESNEKTLENKKEDEKNENFTENKSADNNVEDATKSMKLEENKNTENPLKAESTIKITKKTKKSKSRSNNDKGLENLLGNGGIIVITQSFQPNDLESDNDGSDSE